MSVVFKFMFCLLSGVIWVLASASTVHARGPYLPQDADLRLPGTLEVRDGLNERCDDSVLVCHGYSEFVLVKTLTGFEFGSVGYDCVTIDDGAYGALSCAQVVYAVHDAFTSCQPLSIPPIPAADLEFRGWYCTK